MYALVWTKLMTSLPSSARAAPQSFLRPARRGSAARRTGCFETHASVLAPPSPSSPCASSSTTQHVDLDVLPREPPIVPSRLQGADLCRILDTDFREHVPPRT